MATSCLREMLWYGFMTLTLRVGSMGSGDVVVRNGGSKDYCDAEVFQAKCAKHEVIFIQAALYGRMRTGRCVDTDFGFVGCGKNVLHIADWMCSGRPHCQIPIPNWAFKKATDCPKDLKPYFEAEYKCIKVETAPEQRCTAPKASYILPSAPSGYLANYVTVETKKGSADCPWMIQGRKGQRVNLTVYDFARKDLRQNVKVSVGSEGTICRVYAVVREQGKSRGSTICSGNGRIAHAYISNSHAVEVRILSKMDDNTEYFLIKYDIVGCADPDVPSYVEIDRETENVALLRCPSTNQKWRLICDGNRWTGSFGNCTEGTREPTFGEIVWGNLFMSFEVSLVIVVGIAVGIGIIILAIGVVCIQSACKGSKKVTTRNAPKTRPVNSVPPQRPIPKRSHCDTLPKPPPRSPGIVSRTTDSHGPLPPPPSFLMDKDTSYVTENEYSYIADLPPPPPSPTLPPPISPFFKESPDVVLSNPMTYDQDTEESDDPDYTNPPTPYTSPRHTHYDVGSLRSSDGAVTNGYVLKNQYTEHPRPNFSMKIYNDAQASSDPPPPYVFETSDPDMSVPCDSHNGQGPGMFSGGSLQSRYWRNKTPGIYNLASTDDTISVNSRNGTL